jgi:hypothetical protein
MNLDTWQKIAQFLLPFLLGVCTIYLGFRQFLLGTKNSYRDEYKFAKCFFDDIKAQPDLHKYARHKGYQAILGNRSFPSEIAEYLLHTSNPVRAVSDYRISRSYLDHSTIAGKLELRFRSDFRFSTIRRRELWLFFYAAISVLLYLFAFLPLFSLNFKLIPSSVALSLSAFTFPFGIYGTFIFAFEYIKLHRAIGFIKRLSEENQLMSENQISGEEHY